MERSISLVPCNRLRSSMTEGDGQDTLSMIPSIVLHSAYGPALVAAAAAAAVATSATAAATAASSAVAAAIA